MLRRGNSNSNYSDSSMVNDKTNNIKILDNLVEPINITFSALLPLNLLDTKLNTSFAANKCQIKKKTIKLRNRKIWSECFGSFEGNKKNIIYQNVTHQVHLILYVLL